MKKLGIIASFIVILVATTTVGPKSAQAGAFMCVRELTIDKSGTRIAVNECVALTAFGFSVNQDLDTSFKSSKYIFSSGDPAGNVTITKPFDDVFSPWLIISGISGGTWNFVDIEVHVPDCSPGGIDPRNDERCELVFLLRLLGVRVVSVQTIVTDSGEAMETAILAGTSQVVVFP